MKHLLIVIMAATFGLNSYGQETPPEKHLKYTLSISGLKTEGDAEQLEAALSSVEGMDNEEVIFLEYQLIFETTNLLMREHHIMNKIKAVLAKNGVEIQLIEKEEIR